MSVAAMAKPKGKPGPKPDPENVRRVFVNIRCRPEWREWLARYAQSKGMDMSELVDEAVLRMARADGHREMPPER